MDHEEATPTQQPEGPGAKIRERLAALGYDGDHSEPCAGLVGRCPNCIALYRAVVGDERPTCMICEGQHFAYEPHWAPDAVAAYPWRFPSVLARYTQGAEGQ